MSAASALGLALQKPIIPIIPEYEKIDNLPLVTLIHSVNMGSSTSPRYEKWKAEILKASTGNIEIILRTIDEFEDITLEGRLKVTTGWLTIGT